MKRDESEKKELTKRRQNVSSLAEAAKDRNFALKILESNTYRNLSTWVVGDR